MNFNFLSVATVTVRNGYAWAIAFRSSLIANKSFYFCSDSSSKVVVCAVVTSPTLLNLVWLVWFLQKRIKLWKSESVYLWEHEGTQSTFLRVDYAVCTRNSSACVISLETQADVSREGEKKHWMQQCNLYSCRNWLGVAEKLVQIMCIWLKHIK